MLTVHYQDMIQEQELAEWQVELESDNAFLIEILQTGLALVSSVVEIQLIHDLCLKD
ncbi:hypothetical protein Golob_024573 [Gossypium lobatum]|uniref:Uncharacterized protein n=1 Tax=Gossypium lobatum TaxID=34289 RepID=A0A7J8NLC4_9ROSI|nr:hypothetical protein [Gossypium lobatum]